MITAQHDPADRRSNTEIYQQILDLCVTAEAEGFDAAWLTEHHFVDDGYMPGLLPVAAAIAARTTTLRIGTGVALAPLHHPFQLAEDAATVDLLSAGRLVLGLGAGYRDEEFAAFGVPKQKLGRALDDTLATLRGAWGPGTVTAPGSHVPVSVTPKPHRPGGPPIWLGARTGAGIRRVARAADGLIAARVTPDQLADQVQVLEDAAIALDRDPGELTISVHCPVLAWPDDTAWDLIEPHLYYSEWKYRDMVGEPYGERTTPPGRPGPLTDDVRGTLRAGALVGTPGQVADGIAAFRAAAAGHPFHFTARLYWPGMDPHLQHDVVTVFGSEVISKWPAGATEAAVR